MKRLILTALLLACLVGGAMAAVSPIKTNFQNFVEDSSRPSYQGDWILYSNIYSGWASTTTTGLVYPWSYRGGDFSQFLLKNRYSELFTYASFTTWGTATSVIRIYDSSSVLLYSYTTSLTSTPSRYEVKMLGGSAYVYRDGTEMGHSGVLSTNPSYVTLEWSTSVRGAPAYVDDAIVGYYEDSVVLGSLPQNWFILYDSVSPASTGLYKLNTTFGGLPLLKNSNYFSASYGRGTSTATTLQLINPMGAIVKSYPVSNYSCQCTLPITDLYQDGIIYPGYWTVQLADSPLAQEHFWVISGTAAVSLDKTSYLIGDTAVATYSIPDSYWDTTTYSYKLRLVDVYGTTLSESSIVAKTSSDYVPFATADGAGVRFIEVVRIKTSDSTESIIGYTSTTIYEYLGFNIHTYDASTTSALTLVRYNFTQGSTIVTGNTSSFDGNASVSGFGTGAVLMYNFTKTGYKPWNFSFTPLATGTKTLDVALYPSSPSVSNVSVGGVIHDTVYGNIIPAATVTATNGTTFSTTANIRGGYSITGLTTGTCYQMGATKTGFLFASPAELQCVVSS